MNQQQYEHADVIFQNAVQAVQPKVLLHKYIKRTAHSIVLHKTRIAVDHKTQIKIIAVGKAAWAMAYEAESILGSLIVEGVCITKYKHAGELQYCEIVEAAHPVPNANSVLAANKVKCLLQNTNAKQIVILLLSGGASSLLVDVPSAITLAHLQTTFELLVNSGLSIHDINIVRKHLSELKGGGLAKLAHPARLFSFIISDVVGDNVDVIASGPSVPDESTFSDAYGIVEKAGLLHKLPKAIVQYLVDGKNGVISETPKANHPCFATCSTAVIGSNQIALRNAVKAATQLGYRTFLVRNSIQSSAETAADFLLKILMSKTITKPTCLIAGGETTVAITEKLAPKGGRNIHLVLEALAAESRFNFSTDVLFFSGATDGTDGTSETAGAMAFLQDPAHDKDVVNTYRQNFKSFYYFEKMGGLYFSQATQTNVMDIIILIAMPR